MKKSLFLIIVFIVLNLFVLSANAEDTSGIQDIYSSVGATELQSEHLAKDELDGSKSINIFEKAVTIIFDSLSDGKSSLLASFGMIFATIVLCAAMNAMKFGGSESLDSAGAYISVLALSGVAYSVLYKLFILVIAAMESLNLAVSSLLPVMATLHSFGGTASSGAVSNSGLIIFLTVISTICTKVLLPLMQASFALCLVGAMPGSVNLSSVTSLVKNTATLIMSFLFSLLGFSLYLQTSIASAADTYLTRSLRFASGTFVPVIGGMLGDAAKTVLASVSVVKSTVGAAGVVMILSAIIPPLIAVILNKLLLLLCAITAKTLGCDRESAFLYDLGSILSILLALLLGSGAVILIALALFIKSGVTV